MFYSLQNKVALVTGGSRGIGAAIVERLASAGAKVYVNYQSNKVAAEEVLARIKKQSPQSEIIAFDISNASAVETSMEELIKKEGRLDILVCNAGISRDALLPRSTAEHFMEVLNTNLLGSIHCVRVASRSMMRNRYGRVVCMSSVIGEMGNKGQSAYAASKSGLFGFVKSVAKELGSRNVTCNIVAPGFIETEMTKDFPEELKASYLANIPSGRMGSAAEVAAAVHFLVSEEAAYISGACLDVNGGLLMR